MTAVLAVRLPQQRRPSEPQIYLVPLVHGAEVLDPASGLRRAPARPTVDGRGVAAEWTLTDVDKDARIDMVGVAAGSAGPVQRRWPVTCEAQPYMPGDTLTVVVPLT